MIWMKHIWKWNLYEDFVRSGRINYYYYYSGGVQYDNTNEIGTSGSLWSSIPSYNGASSYILSFANVVNPSNDYYGYILYSRAHGLPLRCLAS